VRAAARRAVSPGRAAARAARPDLQTAVVEPDFETVAKADERIPREPLAAFDALEQKVRRNGLSFRYADTGVSRSAAMSNEVLSFTLSVPQSRETGDAQQKTHPR
jgi:hypothetical protein